jgi:hypothetical protein
MATLATVALPLALPPENGAVLREVQEAGEVRVFCATWNMHGKVRGTARRTHVSTRCVDGVSSFVLKLKHLYICSPPQRI